MLLSAVPCIITISIIIIIIIIVAIIMGIVIIGIGVDTLKEFPSYTGCFCTLGLPLKVPSTKELS